MKTLLTALVVLCACAKPADPAPGGLVDNVHWWWVNGESATDAELLDAAGKLATAAGADALTKPIKSQQDRLTDDELSVVMLKGTNDPSKARGLLVINKFACTLDKLEAIVIAKDQKAQYKDVYDEYDRQYTTDVDAFTSRKSKTLTWDVAQKISLPVSDQYSATVKGSVRRVDASTTTMSSVKGPILVARTFLPKPATFVDTNSQSYFKQDYQMEMYWEQTPGTIFHAYGMWREIKIGGFNLTLEDNQLVGIVLDNLVKWDDATVELCKK